VCGAAPAQRVAEELVGARVDIIVAGGAQANWPLSSLNLSCCGQTMSSHDCLGKSRVLTPNPSFNTDAPRAGLRPPPRGAG
jgi:hypothetical protein